MFLVGVPSRLTFLIDFFAIKPFGFSVLAATDQNESAESFDTNVTL